MAFTTLVKPPTKYGQSLKRSVQKQNQLVVVPLPETPTPTPSPTPTETPTPSPTPTVTRDALIYGDINYNLEPDASDAQFLMQIAAGDIDWNPWQPFVHAKYIANVLTCNYMLSYFSTCNCM